METAHFRLLTLSCSFGHNLNYVHLQFSIALLECYSKANCSASRRSLLNEGKLHEWNICIPRRLAQSIALAASGIFAGRARGFYDLPSTLQTRNICIPSRIVSTSQGCRRGHSHYYTITLLQARIPLPFRDVATYHP